MRQTSHGLTYRFPLKKPSAKFAKFAIFVRPAFLGASFLIFANYADFADGFQHVVPDRSQPWTNLYGCVREIRKIRIIHRTRGSEGIRVGISRILRILRTGFSSRSQRPGVVRPSGGLRGDAVDLLEQGGQAARARRQDLSLAAGDVRERMRSPSRHARSPSQYSQNSQYPRQDELGEAAGRILQILRIMRSGLLLAHLETGTPRSPGSRPRPISLDDSRAGRQTRAMHRSARAGPSHSSRSSSPGSIMAPIDSSRRGRRCSDKFGEPGGREVDGPELTGPAR
jgi:hypothetical protein